MYIYLPADDGKEILSQLPVIPLPSPRKRRTKFKSKHAINDYFIWKDKGSKKEEYPTPLKERIGAPQAIWQYDQLDTVPIIKRKSMRKNLTIYKLQKRNK